MTSILLCRMKMSVVVSFGMTNFLRAIIQEVNSTSECNSSIDKILKTSVNVEKELKALKSGLAGVNTKLQHVRSKVGHVSFVFLIFGCIVFGAYNEFWK